MQRLRALLFPTLLCKQLFPRPATGIEYSASKRDRNRWIFFLLFSLIICFGAK
jgi:hypothetical protein